MELLKKILNSDKKPLLKNEFKFIFPEEDYETYLSSYYERKIGLLYKYNYNKIWFRDRYFDDTHEGDMFEEKHKKFLNFINENGLRKTYDNLLFEEGNFYILFTLPDEFNMSDFETLAKKEKVEKYSYVQNDNMKMYSRTGIFIVDIEYKANEIYDMLRSNNFKHTELRPAASFKQKVSHLTFELADYDRLLKILNYFNMRNNTSYEIPDNITEKFLYGIYLLRFTFHFCFYCFKKYDSERHFFINCGDVHIYAYINNMKDRKVFERNFEFLDFNYSQLSNMSIESVLISTYISYVNWKEICSECEAELLLDYTYRIEHFKNRHPVIYEKISVAVADSKVFLQNIDFLIIEILNNFGNRRQLPDLLKNFDQYNVRYDLPFVYEDI